MKNFLIFALALGLAFPAFAGSSDLLGMYKGYEADSQAALTQPHRSIHEMGQWVSNTAAEALQFAPGQASTKLNALKSSFSEQGYQSYLGFLNAMGLTFSLKNQSLKLSSIVTAAPVLIGQGASAGRYAWVYEMPVVLTIGGSQPLSKEAILRIQVGRSARANNDAGVLIESWQEYKEPARAQDSTKP